MNLKYRAFDFDTDWGWVNKQIPVLYVEDTTGIMAVDIATNELVAGCIFDNWTPTSVQVHLMVVSPMVFRHDFLRLCYQYVFDYKKLKVLFGLVPGNNGKALKLNTRMGWQVVARMEDAFAEGVDSVLMSCTRKHWESRCG